MPDFLLEIGTEEIPARMIDAASAELRERVAKLLERERLPAASAPTSVDTPKTPCCESCLVFQRRKRI